MFVGCRKTVLFTIEYTVKLAKVNDKSDGFVFFGMLKNAEALLFP